MSATATVSLESVQGDSERQQWQEQLLKLAADDAHLQGATAMHRFAIGDLLAAGEKKWRHVYEDAAKILNDNYTVRELYAFTWVARKVKSYLRKEVLPWSHYMAVAPLEESLQEQYLTEAAETGMSVSALRRRINPDAESKVKTADAKGVALTRLLEDILGNGQAKVVPTCQDKSNFHMVCDGGYKVTLLLAENQIRALAVKLKEVPSGKPFKKIKVHFASLEDMDNFAELIGKQTDPENREIWF